MRTSTAIIWIIIIIVVILGGWWWYTSTQTTTGAPVGTLGLNGSPNQGNMGEGSTTPAVSVASSSAGSYLVAENGMTLYVDANDGNGVSNCTGSCAQTWPPYAPAGAAPLIGGLNVSGTLSTITRSDGTQQITYRGMPLYFYRNDAQPGDTTGQGVGGIWSVARP